MENSVMMMMVGSSIAMPARHSAVQFCGRKCCVRRPNSSKGQNSSQPLPNSLRTNGSRSVSFLVETEKTRQLKITGTYHLKTQKQRTLNESSGPGRVITCVKNSRFCNTPDRKDRGCLKIDVAWSKNSVVTETPAEVLITSAWTPELWLPIGPFWSIREMQIPARKVMPRQQETRWKVMGLNPSTKEISVEVYLCDQLAVEFAHFNRW